MVTQGATLKSANPDLNMVNGLFATLRMEVGGSLARLGLDPHSSLDSDRTAALVARVSHYVLSVSARDGEDRDYDFAERYYGIVLIPCYVKDNEVGRFMASVTHTAQPGIQSVVQQDRPLKLKIEKPSLLDSIYFTDDHRVVGEPGPDGVDIEVHATALNFRDVMTVGLLTPFKPFNHN